MWNYANVLWITLKAITKEISDTWFAMLYLGNKLKYKKIDRVRELEERNTIKEKS